MWVMVASARRAWSLAGCAAFLLIAVQGPAVGQALDPGWQLVYAGQPGYGGGGLIDSLYGDGTGLPIVARAYQPAPGYYPPPGYYQPAAPASAADYYRRRVLLQPPIHQPAPVYYQQVPVQGRGSQSSAA